MKQIASWLQAKISRSRNSIVAEPPRAPVRVKPYGPGNDVLMPDIYADQHVANDPCLKILDPSSPDIDKSTGFDPYDTAVLRK